MAESNPVVVCKAFDEGVQITLCRDGNRWLVLRGGRLVLSYTDIDRG